MREAAYEMGAGIRDFNCHRARGASGVNLHDFGTTFKAYRAEILKDINLYGELHRFIPALASIYGAQVAEFRQLHIRCLSSHFLNMLE
jgi:hypothetical protein